MKKTLKPNQKDPESKKKQIINLFNSISPNYDSLNRIMTFGIDIVWRKRVVRLVQKQKHNSILDIATGTGDLALSLARLNSNIIIGLDVSKEILDKLLKRYIETQIYQAVIENNACEQAAKMIAMKNASENAEEIIKELQLLYNNARQASITQELSEIVGGAAAI